MTEDKEEQIDYFDYYEYKGHTIFLSEHGVYTYVGKLKYIFMTREKCETYLDIIDIGK